MSRPAGSVEHALGRVLGEILGGSEPDSGLLLNRGDDGLLASLGWLSAADASARPSSGTASTAAHADHLRYDLSLLNRWRRGEQPYEDADWTTSWQENTVTDAEWDSLRDRLRAESEAFQDAVGGLLEAGGAKATGALAGVAHLAYHLGAIRQIDRSLRGPDAEQNRLAADHFR